MEKILINYFGNSVSLFDHFFLEKLLNILSLELMTIRLTNSFILFQDHSRSSLTEVDVVQATTHCSSHQEGPR